LDEGGAPGPEIASRPGVTSQTPLHFAVRRRNGLFAATLMALTALTGGAPALGSYVDNPPPVPGWTHAPAFVPNDSALDQGVLLSGKPVVRSSPTIAEIDGNAADGREVVVGGDDGILYEYGADGQLRWSVNVLPGPCNASDGLLNTQPTVGDLEGDGIPEVVVGYGTSQPSNCDGGIAVYDGPSGALRWRFSLRAWQQSEGYPPEGLYGLLSSPALADTEGDGRQEIAFGGLDRNLYLLNFDGSVRWYYVAADTITSSPAFANIDDDPQLELIVGTDISANSFYGITDGGFVYAFDTQPRFPARIEFNEGYLWRTPNLGQVVYSSPAIGDVLPDSPGDEIVVGSGCYFPAGTADKTGKWLKILRARDGVELQTLEVPPGGTCVQSSPALGDIDDDGKLEVVVAMGWAMDSGGDGLSRIVAWDPEDPMPKWSMVPSANEPAGNDPSGGDLQSVVIADLDGNGSLEVLAANFWSVVVVNGRDGTPLTCQDSGCGSQPALYAWATVKSTPAIGDIDMDGQLDVVIGGFHINAPAGHGVLYAWTGFAGLLGSPPGLQEPYSAPWPKFRGLPAQPGAGGPPVGPCDTLASDSAAGVACAIEQLRQNSPCVLSKRTSRLLQRASKSLLQSTSAPSPRLQRRLLRRCSVALKKAMRPRANPFAVANGCFDDLQTRIAALGDRVAVLGAPTP
jgi:hypothetical protein